jgi:hypothetical protein
MYSSYSFLTSAVEGGKWSASRPGRAFSPRETAQDTHCTGGWVGPRASLDAETRGKMLCPCQGSNHDRPVHSQSLILTELPDSQNCSVLVVYVCFINPVSVVNAHLNHRRRNFLSVRQVFDWKWFGLVQMCWCHYGRSSRINDQLTFRVGTASKKCCSQCWILLV